MNADYWLQDRFSSALHNAVLPLAKWPYGTDECRLTYTMFRGRGAVWTLERGHEDHPVVTEVDKHVAGALLADAAWRWLAARRPTWSGGNLMWAVMMRFCPDGRPLDEALAEEVARQMLADEDRAAPQDTFA